MVTLAHPSFALTRGLLVVLEDTIGKYNLDLGCDTAYWVFFGFTAVLGLVPFPMTHQHGGDLI